MGFTWSDLAYALSERPLLIQSLDLWGLYGLSGVVLFLLGAAALPERRRSLVAAVLLVALLAYGAMHLRRGTPDGPTFEVAMIQPNLSPAQKWEDENRRAVVDQALRLSTQSVTSTTDLMIWPETATPFRVLDHPGYLERLRRWTRTHDVPLLLGTPHVDWAETLAIHRNAALVLAPDAEGPPPMYRKQQLVPFSEWLPWSFLRLMEINFGQADFTPGTSSRPLPTGEHQAGILICIETIFPRLARRTVREGADYLVVVTNDVWFGRSAAIHQHSAWARLRSVETRRPLVRCGNTGVTMFVDRVGRVTDVLPIFEEGTLRGLIRPETGRTLYVRLGDWLVLLAAIVAVALLVTRGRGPRRTSVSEEIP
jgi:apolipoprotein N-acyltransferase